MLMGAAHNALWAFNARVSLTLPVRHRLQAATLTLRPDAVRSPVTVVPSCGLETRSWRTGRMARHKQECIRLPYTAAFDEEKAKALMDEKAKLQIQLDRIADTKQKRENAKSRLDEIFTIIEALANHPISYDDQIVRQILESVIVESKEKIKVVFVGGLEVTQTI